MNAIEAAGLVKVFPRRKGLSRSRSNGSGATTALDGVSFTVAPGEVMGLIGPNGGGKTTLIKILCTLLVPTAGTARVNGCDVEKQATDVKRSVGYGLDSERSFYYRLSGRQNLAFFAPLLDIAGRAAARRIDEVLDLVGLSADADGQFMTYSTGMRQRLGLARALLANPPILFLDEPTKSLDPVAARGFRQFVKERLVRGMGRTLLLATHTMEEAEYLCDRIIMLDHGKVRATGTYAEVSPLVRG